MATASSHITFNDIRRQTVIDLTNALTSATRQRRVLEQQPRTRDENHPLYALELAASKSLDAAIDVLKDARDKLEELDKF